MSCESPSCVSSLQRLLAARARSDALTDAQLATLDRVAEMLRRERRAPGQCVLDPGCVRRHGTLPEARIPTQARSTDSESAATRTPDPPSGG